MEKEVFSYLEKDYSYLNNYIRDINEVIFTSPHEAIIKGRTFVEKLTQEVAKLEDHGLLSNMTQIERLRILENDGVFTEDVNSLFHAVRIIGNKAAHENVEGELEAALNIHKNIYKIASWFVEVYIDPNYEALPYKNPMPVQQSQSEINIESLKEIMNKTVKEALANESQNINSVKQIPDEIAVSENENVGDPLTGLLAESIIDDRPSKKCLIEQLERLKESSREAVESLNTFTDFKRYMHIEREAQKVLDDLIQKAYKSTKAQIILVCGSVGDGKSHIISYFKHRYPEMMSKFTLHNDATESLEPSKTSMDTLNEMYHPERLIATQYEFIDIAGLVKGASTGEGLGNKFLANIREVDAIVQVVRCFDNKDIIHVEGTINPLRDIEIVNYELILSDLEIVETRLQKIEKKAVTSNDKESLYEVALLHKIKDYLSEGKMLRLIEFDEKEIKLMKSYNLITNKPFIYLANVSEDDILSDTNEYVQEVRKEAEKENASVVLMCAKIESELAELDEESKVEFLKDLGIQNSGLDQLIHITYYMLGLKTFFTVGTDEVRAWTFKNGMKAPECAGIIHTDFERGFIRAEVMSYDDLIKYGSELKVKEAGKARLEGKEYLMQDGDICYFRFNVTK